MCSEPPEGQEILKKPCNTPKEMEDLCTMLKDPAYKKRLVSFSRLLEFALGAQCHMHCCNSSCVWSLVRSGLNTAQQSKHQSNHVFYIFSFICLVQILLLFIDV